MEYPISGKYFILESDSRFPLVLPVGEWQNLTNKKFNCPEGCSIYLLSGHNNLYVGSDGDGNRPYDHKSNFKCASHSNNYMQNVVNKYGLQIFFYQPLVKIPEEYVQFRDEIENSYIKLFDTFHSGYNLCEFADTPNLNKEPWNKGKINVYSQETLKKMSDCHKGTPAWNKGKKHPEETKRKISESHKGILVWNKGKKNIYSEETLKKMSENRKGKVCGKNHPNFGKSHSLKVKEKISVSQKKRYKILGDSPLKGKQRPENVKQKISIANTGKIHPTLWVKIKCVETGIIYNSITEASKKTDIRRSNISGVLIGKQNTAGGYHWEYLNKKEEIE